MKGFSGSNRGRGGRGRKLRFWRYVINGGPISEQHKNWEDHQAQGLYSSKTTRYEETQCGRIVGGGDHSRPPPPQSVAKAALFFVSHRTIGRS